MIDLQLWRLAGPATCDFLLHTGRQLGPGWAGALFPAGLHLDGLSPRAQRFLSRHLATQLELSLPAAAFEADPLCWAIALLPPERLERFQCHLGATLVAHEVRQAIEHHAVKAYREALGDPLYWFVMERVPLICRASDTTTHRWGPEHMMAAVRASGWRALQQIVESHSTALSGRLLLKLPKPLAPDLLAQVTDTAELNNLRRMAWRILRETEATWIHPFLPTTEAPSSATAS